MLQSCNRCSIDTQKLGYRYMWIWTHVCLLLCLLFVSDEFCIEMRRESNPRGSKLRSHTVSDLNYSANRVYTIGTECSHHMYETGACSRVGSISSASQCKIHELVCGILYFFVFRYHTTSVPITAGMQSGSVQ